MQEDSHIEFQIQGPVLLPFANSLKEFLVVMVVLLQGPDFGLMQVEKFFCKIICGKKNCTETATNNSTLCLYTLLLHKFFCGLYTFHAL